MGPYESLTIGPGAGVDQRQSQPLRTVFIRNLPASYLWISHEVTPGSRVSVIVPNYNHGHPSERR